MNLKKLIGANQSEKSLNGKISYLLKGGDSVAVDIKQGDIIIIDFDPSLGHEQKGNRPALVVSNHDFTRLTQSLVKVVPISTTNNKFPLHIPVPEGLKVHGVAEVQQETTLDLGARRWRKVDHVPDYYLNQVLEAIFEAYESEQ